MHGRACTLQALELGLVDRLGGLADAVALAKKEAGLPEKEGAVRVKQVGTGWGAGSGGRRGSGEWLFLQRRLQPPCWAW